MPGTNEKNYSTKKEAASAGNLFIIELAIGF
jgi:hypothetical protein